MTGRCAISSIGSIYVECRGDISKFSSDMTALRSLAKKSGKDVSDALNNAILPDKARNAMAGIATGLTQLSQSAKAPAVNFKATAAAISKDFEHVAQKIGMTSKEFANLNEKALKNQAFIQADAAMKQIARTAGLTSKEIKALAVQMGHTAKDAERMAAGFNKAGSGGQSFLGSIMSLRAGAIAYGLAISGVVYSLKSMGDAIFEAGQRTLVAENAYRAITGSAKNADREFGFLKKTSEDLGLNFYTLRDGYKGFLAAAQSSKIPMEEVREIFKSISNAGAVMGLSNERMSLTFLALEQMMSKGKVSMEELRRQLGDNLPGAFQIGAKAMGMTVEAFDKAVSAGEVYSEEFLPKFRVAMDEAFQGTVADSVKAVNKLAEAWEAAKNAMADERFMGSIVSGMKSITEMLKDPEFIQGMRDAAALLASMAESSAKGISFAGRTYGNAVTAGKAEEYINKNLMQESDVMRAPQGIIATDTLKAQVAYLDNLVELSASATKKISENSETATNDIQKYAGVSAKEIKALIETTVAEMKNFEDSFPGGPYKDVKKLQETLETYLLQLSDLDRAYAAATLSGDRLVNTTENQNAAMIAAPFDKEIASLEAWKKAQVQKQTIISDGEKAVGKLIEKSDETEIKSLQDFLYHYKGSADEQVAITQAALDRIAELRKKDSDKALAEAKKAAAPIEAQLQEMAKAQAILDKYARKDDTLSQEEIDRLANIKKLLEDRARLEGIVENLTGKRSKTAVSGLEAEEKALADATAARENAERVEKEIEKRREEATKRFRETAQFMSDVFNEDVSAGEKAAKALEEINLANLKSTTALTEHKEALYAIIQKGNEGAMSQQEIMGRTSQNLLTDDEKRIMLADEYRKRIEKITKAYREIEDQMDPFGAIGRELEDKLKALDDYKIKVGIEISEEDMGKMKSFLQTEALTKQINHVTGAASEAASSIQSMFNSGSKEYKIMEVALKSIAVVEGVIAVLNQGKGDPYSAFARMAAMAAAVAALGVSIGNVSGGGGVSGADGYETAQKVQGTGSVLGDAEAKSNSILNAAEITADATSELVGINRDMLTALTGLQEGIVGATTSMARVTGGKSFGSVELGSVSDLWGYDFLTDIPIIGDVVGFLGGLVDGLIGGSSEIINGGIRIMQDTLGNLTQNADVDAFQVQSVKKWAWSSASNYAFYSDLPQETEDQVSLIFQGIGDSVYEAAKALQLMDTTELENMISSFYVDQVIISLQGLDADAKQEEITAVFSEIFDNLAGEVAPWVSNLQALGEGLGETLVRIATDVRVLEESLIYLGFTAQRTSAEQFAELSVALIEGAGGLGTYIDSIKSFFKNFSTQIHQNTVNAAALTTAFKNMGMVLPESREAMWALMQAQDASTEAGQNAIITILGLQDASDAYYTSLESQIDALNEFRGESNLDVFLAKWDMTIDDMVAYANRVLNEDLTLEGISDYWDDFGLTVEEALGLMTDALDETAEAAEEAAEELKEYSTLLKDFDLRVMEASGDTAGVKRYNRESEMNSLNDLFGGAGERNLFETLQVGWAKLRLAMVYAAEDTAEAAELAKKAAEDAAKIQEEITNERLGLERQLLELQGDTNAIRALELAALDPSNQALQLRIWALIDEKTALEDAEKATTDMVNALTKAVEDARGIYADAIRDEMARAEEQQAMLENQLANAKDAYIAAIQREIDAQNDAKNSAEDLLSEWESVADSLRDYAKDLAGSEKSNMMPDAMLSYSLNAFRSGSAKDLPDLSNNLLDAALAALTDPAEYARIFDEVQAKLKDSLAEAESQVSLAQQQVNGIQYQIELYEQQIDNINGTNDLLLSISEADAKYREAQIAIEEGRWAEQIDYYEQELDRLDRLTNATYSVEAALGMYQSAMINMVGSGYQNLAANFSAQLAALQGTEAVIPLSSGAIPVQINSGSGSNDPELKDLLRQLLIEVRAGKSTSQKMARLIDRVEAGTGTLNVTVAA